MYTTIHKGSLRFNVFEKNKAILIWQKYSKNSNNTKYYFNLK